MKENNTQPRVLWGVLSGDDETGSSEAGFDTLNDIELLYFEDTEEYTIGLETIHSFGSREEEKAYMKYLLDKMTEWMQGQGYNTDVIMNYSKVFQENRDRFRTVEEAYQDFKLKVTGFCNL